MAKSVENVSITHVKTSKDLLRSEYISESEHVLNTLVKQDKGGKLKTFPMKCSALSRVKDFLPQMLEAQNSLKAKTEEEINIENVDGCDNIVEMNIAVYETSDSSDDESEFSSNSDDSESSLGDKLTKPKLVQEINLEKTDN